MKPTREGLPANYRMRADPHYVEQLTAGHGPMPLRLVPIAAIDSPKLGDHSEVEGLIESIRAFGVLHPLLLRMDGGRYQLIAGRRRLLAAKTIGLISVPCFVHDVEGAAAEHLAEADNIRCSPEPQAGERLASSDRSGDVLRYLAGHLTGIASAQQLLTDSARQIERRPALDLIHAHTTLARWLIRAANLTSGRPDPTDQRHTLGALIDDLVADFAPQSRLIGVPLRARIDDRAYTARFNRNGLSVGLMGALVAFAPFVDVENGGALTLAAARSNDTLTLDLGQAPTLMDAGQAGRFFDAAWIARPGGWPSLVGALALEAAVRRQGGTVACEAHRAEARLRIAFPDKR